MMSVVDIAYRSVYKLAPPSVCPEVTELRLWRDTGRALCEALAARRRLDLYRHFGRWVVK